MQNWDEVRTAYHVARLGTVSAAAAELGVHHSTVIRHVDALEQRLGVKLFQRHQRGYTPTEAGEDLLQVARTTDEQFSQLAGRLHGRGAAVCGELVVTTLAELSALLIPVLVRFQKENPEVTVQVIADERVLKLEYGEAHLAVRAGPAPEEPDNVVRPLGKLTVAGYAHRDYIAAHGRPASLDDLGGHSFIGVSNPNSRAPSIVWMRDNLPEEQIRFRVATQTAVADAVQAGAGIGFLAVWRGRAMPDLVEVLAPRAAWAAPIWQVTHVDLHRTNKVQAFARLLAEAAADWPDG